MEMAISAGAFEPRGRPMGQVRAASAGAEMSADWSARRREAALASEPMTPRYGKVRVRSASMRMGRSVEWPMVRERTKALSVSSGM